ncbi:MAG TPA: antibiotic biosynthesis monooxygenase family protein [Novosphingobium sp.]|nr:antibiotic biosynthesis monooxygenase family protein [Novosphingobium sp.]
MAFSFLSRFRIRPEQEAAFITLARQMEALSAEEPGTLHYQFFRLAEPGLFAVYESFVDAAADKAHIAAAANQPLIARMIACMDGPYEREMLYDLAPAAETADAR